MKALLFMLRGITLFYFLLFCSPHIFAETKSKRPSIKYFEGSWQITSGNVSDILTIGFGKISAGVVDRPNSSFVFYSNHNGQNVVHRFGNASYSGTTVRGSFDSATNASIPDNVAALGIGASGNFVLKLDPGSIRTLSGTFTSKGGAKTAVTAKRITTDIKNTTFVLGIEPLKRKVYSVGELITFKATAALRGPAAVDSEQPDIALAFDPAITEITVINTSNITGCSVNLQRSPAQVLCSFAVLGPKSLEAKVFVQVRVPAELEGDRLSAAIDVESIDPEDAADNDIEPLIVNAATRVSRVKIKKSTEQPCQQYFGSWTTNSGSLILNSNGTYSAVDNGSEGVGLWKCQQESAGTYLYLGMESLNGPLYHSKFLFSDDGKHFEGKNFFGAVYSGNKDS